MLGIAPKLIFRRGVDASSCISLFLLLVPAPLIDLGAAEATFPHGLFDSFLVPARVLAEALLEDLDLIRILPLSFLASKRIAVFRVVVGASKRAFICFSVCLVV